MSKVGALSFSGIKTFLQCPHKFYRTKVLKDCKEDFSHPATIWGNEVHKAIENFLLSGEPLPTRFKMFQEYADALAAIDGKKFVELKLGITEEGKVCNFFGNDVAHRGVLDYLVINGDTAYLIDHKTGKVRPTKQLHYNALLIFAAFPDVQVVKAAFYWLPADTYTKFQFKRNEVDELWGEFEDGLVGLEEAQEKNEWIKKPSGLCPWCPVKDCEHWGPK